jgi:glycerol 3-phosphatase-2
MACDRTQVERHAIMRRVSASDAVSLVGTVRPLAQTYDVALLDLDGVVYVGEHSVPGAPEALTAARDMGMRLAFVTNNAARPPSIVADHLTALGIPALAGEVINSAQAAAHYLSERLHAGARVLVVGTVGLEEALTERGLTPVHGADDEPTAVVQGYSPELNWAQLAEGAVAIRRGLPWVATNVDPTVPSSRGPLPGNGSIVAALRHATGATPVVTGKPDPMMHRESVQRSAAKTPLVVGDRLDTDVEGANAVGCPSLLVLSGVTSPVELITADRMLRPSFVARDLGGLLQTHVGPAVEGHGARCGRWVVTRSAPPELRLTHADATSPGREIDDLDPLRALCAAMWSGPADSHYGDGADRGTIAISAGDADAADAMRSLGLTPDDD